MPDDVQFIITPAGRFAVLPEVEYRRLVDAAEDAHDAAVFERHRRDKAAGEEMIPHEVATRILDGENAVRVYREWREITTKQLAEKAGLSRAYVTQIEIGKREGSVAALKAIADALKLTVDDLVP